MSWEIANCCAKRKFGSPVRKQIIMFLADKASDDGSGIWCSKGTIQRHTELGETTVKRAMNEFLKEAIIVETGKRRCANGYAVVYRIQVDRVNELECIHQNEKRPEFSTGSSKNPVPEPHRTGYGVQSGTQTILKQFKNHSQAREHGKMVLINCGMNGPRQKDQANAKRRNTLSGDYQATSGGKQ